MEGKILQLVVIGLLALIFRLIHFQLIKRFGKERWSEEVRKDKPSLKARMISTFVITIEAPFTEETIFRGPLLLLFSCFNQWAWITIFVSAAIFGFLHTRREKIFPQLKKNPKQLKVVNIVSPVFAFGFGIFQGWLVIKTQSLWWAVVTHFGYNFFQPLAIILGLVGLIVFIIVFLYHFSKEMVKKLLELKKTGR